MRFKNCQSQLFVQKILNENSGQKLKIFKKTQAQCLKIIQKCLIFNSTWIWNPNAPKMVRTLGCKLWKFIRNDFQMRLFWVISKHCVLREEFYNHTESLTWNKEPWLLKWCGNGRWAWWAAAAAAAAAAENGMKNEWRPWFCVGSWAFSQFLAARVA